jgi:hypothetical protein
VKALAIDGSLPPARIATLYGLDPSTVRSLAAKVEGIDVQHVAALKQALPGLFAILAVAHGTRSLELAVDDPALAAKSMFASKMAMEAGMLSQQAEKRPGATMMEFMMRLDKGSVSVKVEQGVFPPLKMYEAGEADAGSPAALNPPIEAEWSPDDPQLLAPPQDEPREQSGSPLPWEVAPEPEVLDQERAVE